MQRLAHGLRVEVGRSAVVPRACGCGGGASRHAHRLAVGCGAPAPRARQVEAVRPGGRVEGELVDVLLVPRLADASARREYLRCAAVQAADLFGKPPRGRRGREAASPPAAGSCASGLPARAASFLAAAASAAFARRLAFSSSALLLAASLSRRSASA